MKIPSIGLGVVLIWLASVLPAGAARPCTFDGTEAPTASKARPSRPVRYVTDVRAGAHRCFDRVVFEFAGADAAPPGFQIAYEQAPIREDGSSRPVPVSGDAFLVVRLTPARDTHVSDGHAEPSYRGPEHVEVPGGTRLVEARHVSSFEGTVKWALGLDRQRPYRVTTLTAPPRVIVDVG